MDIEESYFAVSRFFGAWVRIMEMRARREEIADCAHWGAPVLLLSPPTDPGIALIAEANRSARTALVCFSERLRQAAQDYARARAVGALEVHVSPHLQLPFADGEFAAVYANCFFDFCSAQDIAQTLTEIRRVLRDGGSLYAVYMGTPRNFVNRLWCRAFARSERIGFGCHPVQPLPQLTEAGFEIRKKRAMDRFGFPLRYTVAEKVG